MSERQSKQVLVVRRDLKMRRGKEAAQCAHASMAVLLNQTKKTAGQIRMAVGMPHIEVTTHQLSYSRESVLHDWLNGSFTKIVVSVNTEAELLALRNRAAEAKLLHALIQDSGRTEFHGVPTYTVLAIGPAWADQLDPITGNLPLL